MNAEPWKKWTAEEIRANAFRAGLRGEHLADTMLCEFANMLDAMNATPPANEPASEKSVLREIANIAHAGGLEGLGMDDALVRIRKLSIPYWDKEGATIIRRREVQQ